MDTAQAEDESGVQADMVDSTLKVQINPRYRRLDLLTPRETDGIETGSHSLRRDRGREMRIWRGECGLSGMGMGSIQGILGFPFLGLEREGGRLEELLGGRRLPKVR